MHELASWQDKFETRFSEELRNADSAHDLGHSRRVWNHAHHIASEMQEEVDCLVLLAAAYFHDFVSLKKDDPKRSQASRMAAIEARRILSELEFPEGQLSAAIHAIEAHSHSGQIEALSVEARIIQDADRLEALGAIGLARLFYMAGQQQRNELFHDTDPRADRRALDDRRYALDHYFIKLKDVAHQMNTLPGRTLATERAEHLAEFVEILISEINIVQK